MGSFNVACGISHAPLPPGVDVMLIMIAGGTRRKNTVYISDHYTNIGMAVPAKYYDYGRYKFPYSPQATIVRNIIARSVVNKEAHANTTLEEFTKLIREDDGVQLTSYTRDNKELQCFPVLKHVWDALITETFQGVFDVMNVEHFIKVSQKENDFSRMMRRMEEATTETLRSLIGTVVKDGTIFTQEKFEEAIAANAKPTNVLLDQDEPSRRSYNSYMYVEEVDKQHYQYGVPKDDLVLAHAQTQFFIEMMSHMNIPFSPPMYAGQDYDLIEHSRYLSKIAASVAQHAFDNSDEDYDFVTKSDITQFSVHEVVNLSSLRSYFDEGSPKDAQEFSTAMNAIIANNPGKELIEVQIVDKCPVYELLRYSTTVTPGNGLFIDVTK